MILGELIFTDMMDSPVRRFKGRVELYDGSTLINMFKSDGALKSFTVERAGENSKFFGFGVCQKINVKLRDTKKEIEVKAGNHLEALFGVDSDYTYTFPRFTVTEVHRDENNGELSITAYDSLYAASAHTVAELGLEAPYTIKDVASACAKLLGVPTYIPGGIEAFNRQYDSGANFDGTETIREALNAIAEATQTIYYIDYQWRLYFKKLSTFLGWRAIDKDSTFTLDTKTNRRLSAICHCTELGDNVIATSGVSGTTQYVRSNPFWDMRDDIQEIVEDALAAVSGLTINQFEAEWRGNFFIEPGDCIVIEDRSGNEIRSFLLNDMIEFDGGFRQKTRWSYEDNEEETEANPSSLGDVLKQTYARVDKANKQIEMVVSQVENNNSAIAALQLTTDGINASVQKTTQETAEAIEGVNGEIASLTKKVEATITEEDVNLLISSSLDNGVSKVETTTGFTFDETGLTVSKSGSEMTTTITEDGMTVYRDGDAVLIADNEGVKAEDLHATTYLIVGTYSRFEDYGERTGCFWIG